MQGLVSPRETPTINEDARDRSVLGSVVQTTPSFVGPFSRSIDAQ